MTKTDFVVMVWQMRHYQKSGQKEFAETAEKKVDQYLAGNFEQQINFNE